MNNAMSEFLKSIGVTAGISILIGIAFWALNGLAGFIAGTILGFVVQVIISFLWKSYLIHRSTVDIAEIDSDLQKTEMEQLSKQTVNVNCAYCRVVNKATIRMDSENTFRCSACNQLNIVMITLSTARVTVPLDLNGEALLEKAVGIEVKDLSAPVEFRST